MALLAVPGPFDFALTTERFRAFGVDRASVWHEGGLHRVVGGRELRIEPAPGGVDADPLDAETEPVVRALVGLPFEARLITVRGLGEWTADWFLARHLARPHAWPWGDLALRKAVDRSIVASTCVKPAPASIRSRISPPTTCCSPSAHRDPRRHHRRLAAGPRALPRVWA